jgi:phosphoribosyl-ATP pyrophosphohydrolase
MDAQIFEKLYTTLQERKTADPKKSYVAQLYKKGSKQIAKKLGEEAVELVIESIRLDRKNPKEKRHEAFKNEAADLVFHLLVLLAYHNVAPEEIFEILEQRMGVGGLDEKESRKESEEAAA